MENLERLRLDGTLIKEKEQLILNTPKLQILSMNHVPIEHLDICKGFSSLRRLNVAHTAIKFWNSTSCDTQTLQSIDFARSKLQSIDLSSGAEGLEYLNLRGTHLTKFDTRRFRLPNLKYLYISQLDF